MEDLTGKQLGPYRVVAPLGEGGMAAVYKAYHASMDRYVAVKVLPQHFAKDPQFVGRFRQEAQVLARLQHPHILPVFDYGDSEGYTYIVMPFVESGTLTDLLEGKPLPLNQIRDIVSQVGDALDYAHTRGLIHRDVKPSNVLVDERGNCLLTDFGIAKIVEATSKFTGTGGIVGTPAYMSPEQGRGDKVDARSDIYALGVVLYEMATGRVPFDAETPIAVVFKHIQDPLPMPRAANPALPESLERVILKSLAKSPDDRFVSAGDMVRALKAAIPEVTPSTPAPTLVSPATPTIQTTQPLPAQLRKVGPPKWVSAAIGVGAVLCLVLAAAVGGGAIIMGLINRTPVATTPLIVTAPVTISAPTALVPTADATPVPPPTSLPFTCTDAIGCVDIAPGAPIHIAYALEISGPVAPLGEDSKGAIEIAIDDRGGELLGHPIELTGEDSGCNAEDGLAAGAKLAADPTIVGIIGTNCSSAARAAMPLIFDAGLVMISPSNTNPDLTDPDHPDHWPGYLRTAHNDLFQGRVAAEFAYNVLKVRTAATIHDGSPYAESLQKVFANAFKELGGTVTTQEAINVGDTDMKSVLTKIATGSPEIIYFPVFEPEGDLIAQQAKEVAGLENTILMGADGLFTDTFPEATGEAAIGMYFSGPYVSGPAYEVFLAKWKNKFGGFPPSGFHAHAYDATNLLFAAMEKVAVVDADGTVHIGRQALRDAMYATKDFNGLTGRLTCDANGDCATGEALGVFKITEAEVNGAWPPLVFWQPGK